MRKILFIIIITLTSALGAQEIEHIATINWQTGIITVIATYHGEYSPLLRLNAEKKLDSYIDSFFKDKVFTMQYDSYRTIQDIAIENPKILSALSDLGLNGEKTKSKMGDNLSSMEITYKFHLFPDIVNMFIKHTDPQPIYPTLTYTPSAAYTGIIILVNTPLPVHGEYTEDTLIPSLFPRFFDEQMRSIFTYRNCSPEALKKWGPVMYTADFNEDSYRGRIGAAPIYMSAKAIFGTDRTDIILFQEDTDKLLANEHNIELLKQGKTVIIIVDNTETE